MSYPIGFLVYPASQLESEYYEPMSDSLHDDCAAKFMTLGILASQLEHAKRGRWPSESRGVAEYHCEFILAVLQHADSRETRCRWLDQKVEDLRAQVKGEQRRKPWEVTKAALGWALPLVGLVIAAAHISRHL